MPKIVMRDKQQIHVRVIGKGPPLILLHGFAMESRHWLPFALPLATRYRVIVPDLRGFGRSHSVKHNQDCVLSNYAEDLHDLTEALELENIRLAGISMGALTALQYFKLYGTHRVSRYLHIDQAPKGLNSKDWNWGLFGAKHEQRIQAARRLIEQLEPYLARNVAYDDLPRSLKQMLWNELGLFFSAALSRPGQKKLLRRLLANESLAKRLFPLTHWGSYICCLKAYLEQDYDMRDTLKSIEIPVSILVGMKSEMYPCAGQLRMADHLPQASVIPFKASGHAPLIDEPIHLLKTFFRWAT
ncbi:MAG: alpha/beta hydrolase [Oleiphilaceae bacterium]|nr:alpha/beta hydrolase [Oleiphilaceae bacterium]